MSNRIIYTGSSISSIEALASTLDCDGPHLLRIASDVASNYTPFQVPKKNGGVREIRSPKPTLKAIQKRINSRIFSNCAFPTYLQGSIKDPDNSRDFVSNAAAHSKSKTVISADIENFYPSVRFGVVKEVFKYLLRYSDDVSNVLALLTTLDQALPQGAPTSSYIANLVFYDNEPKLFEEFYRSGLIYTRLIDDITVSSEILLNKQRKNWVIQKITGLLAKKQLTMHRGKLRQEVTNSPGHQVVVTGLWIDKGQPRLSSIDRRNIRAAVYNSSKEYEAGHKTTKDYHDRYNSTSGKVALMTRLGHVQAHAFRDVLTNIKPEYDKRFSKKVERLCWMFIGLKGCGKDKVSYTKRYHKLMYHLAILGRSMPEKAAKLRRELRIYRPILKVSDLSEEAI